MELTLGFFADFAVRDEYGKLVAVGIFEEVRSTQQDGLTSIPNCFVVVNISASIAEGSEHLVALRLLNEDEVEVTKLDISKLPFVPSGPGRPLKARVVVQLVGLKVPRFGDYHMEVAVDGKRVGVIPLYVQQAPA